MQTKVTQSKIVYLNANFQPTKDKPIYVKKILNRKYQELIDNEISWLTKLNKLPWAPKIVSYDDSDIIMTYIGEGVTKSNLPKDWRLQVDSILRDMDAIGCSHNDIKINELLVQDGKLHLIDFHHMTTTREEYMQKRKLGQSGCRIRTTDHEAMFMILGNLEKR